MDHNFVTERFFLREVFKHLALNFVTLFQKYFLIHHICFPKSTFFSKIPFFTSHKCIFSFLVPFQQFKVLLKSVQQIYVKYALFAYAGPQQRSFQIFFNFFPEECFLMVTCTQKVYSQEFMLFKSQHMAGSRSFFNTNFCWYSQIQCYLSYKCYCSHPKRPIKDVIGFVRVHRIFSSQKQRRHYHLLFTVLIVTS